MNTRSNRQAQKAAVNDQNTTKQQAAITKAVKKTPLGRSQKATASPKKHDDSLSQKPADHLKNDISEFDISYGASLIKCNLRPAKASANSSTMIFTHGAGGDIATPAVSNFADGFATTIQSRHAQDGKSGQGGLTSIVCFTGSTNLKSRTAMFRAVIDDCASTTRFSGGSATATVLGGRSMGARAAVIAANDMMTEDSNSKVSKLLLVSYPLLGGNGQVRDEILLEIDESIEVLFISGDKDNMCDLKALDGVRKRMKAKSWVVAVEGSNHGMDCRQKKRTREMQLITGRIAAEWAMGMELKDEDGDVGGMEGCRMMISHPLTKENADGATARVATKGNESKTKRSATTSEKAEVTASKRQKKK